MNRSITKFIFSAALLLAFVAISFVQTGCKKSNDDGPTGTMRCKINGQAWEGKAGSAFLQGLFNVTGTASDGTVLTMTMEGFEQNIFYANLGSSNVIVYSKGSNQSSSATSQNNTGGFIGIAEINTTDSTVAGIFMGTLINPLTNETFEITEGVFEKVPFTVKLVPFGNNTMSVKIDNVAFTPTLVQGIAVSGTLKVIGSDATASKSVSVSMPDDVTPGTYQIGSVFSEYGGQYNVSSSSYLSSDSGTLTITEHDKINKILKGTFNFHAAEWPFGSIEANLTNGSFSVKY